MTHEFRNLDGSVAHGRRVSGHCPCCLRLTTLIVTAHLTLDGSGTKNGDVRTLRFLLQLRCDWCKKDSAYVRNAVVASVPVPGGAHESYRTLTLEQVWPRRTPRELASEAPVIVQEVFAEAALAEAAGAYRLAGIGYRATVEQIVKDKGAAGGNLNQRILALSAMGVPQDIVDAFHEARFVGNDSAHDALAYAAEEIADIAALIHEAVLVIYVQPAQRAQMAQQRAARRASARQTSP